MNESLKYIKNLNWCNCKEDTPLHHVLMRPICNKAIEIGLCPKYEQLDKIGLKITRRRNHE